MLPKMSFRTTGDAVSTGIAWGNIDAGSVTAGTEIRIYNDYDGDGSETATSVNINVRGSTGGIDEVWCQQHWVEVKSDGYSTGSTGMSDDAMTVFQPVGKNSPLGIGDIDSTGYRTLFVRVNAPTDAEEQNVSLQLVTTYQDPQTAITKWITGLRGNGVVASTGDPFAMSTGGATGTIPYEAGYALIDNNEAYYGSSGIYDISTTGSVTHTIYLNESGAFNETTGTLAANELALYEATMSSGVCTDLTDKRVYLAGLQAGTTGAMPSTPDLGDLYLDITNALLYVAKTAGSWDLISANTFLSLTDTPADFAGDANKILRVNTSSGAVAFSDATVTSGGTINIPTGQEYQINGKAFPIFHETFMDVQMANSSGIHIAIAGSTASEQTITTNITNPDIPRNISITVTQNNSPSGNITINGTFADGSTGNEAITISTGGIDYGDRAFGRVSQFVIPITVSSGDTVAVGWSDKIGLCNSFDSSGDIFKLKINATDTSTGIDGNVDTTNHTLNCGAISNYSDIEIWYKL